MFNSTHTFVGFAIAKTGIDKWSRHATATAVIASNLPDLDSVAGFWGIAAYLEHHRGITHSVIGIPIFALLLSALMYPFSGNFGKTYLIALIAMATHPALDYLNPYGWRPFLPLDSTWYYGDFLFIMDPYLDLLLLIGIIIGIARPGARRLAAWSSLIAALLYVGVRIELHAIARSKLNSAVANSSSIEKLAVLPDMWNPFIWDGVVETDKQVQRFTLSVLTDRGLVVDSGPPPGFGRLDVRSSRVVEQAAATESAAAVVCFARFPLIRVEQTASGYRVMFTDFRFYRGGNVSGAEVILDQSLHVVKESLSF
jgi:inner membrane protein